MAEPSPWKDFFNRKIQTLKKDKLHRQMRMFDTMQPGYVLSGQNRLLNLCANDYLGLAADPFTLEEAKLLSEILPMGAGASRLVTGNLAIHHELDKMLAEWKGTEAALVFPSGYQCNVGLLSTLGDRGVPIFSDKLNHASIIDGIQLSGSKLVRYGHRDVDELESLLKESKARKKIIVTDGVFSMDGSVAPLPQINEVAKRYGALLIIDEAHATGVMGKDGAGSWSHFGLPVEGHVILMGTLSKALGGQGGFVCASNEVIEYLTNCCRSFIYSTGLSPFLAALAHYNIGRIRSEAGKREALKKNCGVLKKALRNNGFQVHDDPTPIMPVMLDSNERALEVANQLKEQNIIALAIRPPTVPEGTSRIRLSVCSAHQPKDLENAAKQLAHYVNEENSG